MKKKNNMNTLQSARKNFTRAKNSKKVSTESRNQIVCRKDLRKLGESFLKKKRMYWLERTSCSSKKVWPI